jgi:hypothetical protein
MGATYTRQEASNITDGSVIEAAHLNNELNQLVNAFASSSGHTHDGTSAEGGFVPILADSDANNKILVDTSSNRFGVFVEVSSNPVEQVRFQDGAILPVTNNDIDLGTSSLQFKDAFFDGVITTDSLALPTTTITDILDEDNMSSNSATALATQQSIKAYVDAQITAEDLDFQADSGGALAIDLDSETLTFTGGTGIDTSGSGNAVTFAIDSTVATLAGSQTLTNKSLTAPILTGSSSAAGSILFKEDTDNGTNSVTLIGPAATADVTVTLPAATDTLVGKATTDTLTNKTIDANGTGNSITNLEVADFASGVLDTDISSVSGSDDTLASAKAIKSYVDTQVATVPTGDITAVVAGTGLSGGATSGSATLNIDTGTTVDLSTSQALSNKTLTSPVINTGVSGSAILDEDDFASDSATKLATQQSIKAYIATQVATANELSELTDTNITSAADGALLFYDTSTSKWIDNVVSGDITIADTGVATIAAGAVDNAMLANQAVSFGGISLNLGQTDATPAFDLTDATNYPTSSLTGTITNAQLAGSIADSKLNTITTAGKVGLAALEIDGGTDIGADLTTSDLIIVDDGAGGTNRRAALSRLTTFMTAQGFSTEDPTALAIALG